MASIASDIRTVTDRSPDEPERRAHPRYQVGYGARLTYGTSSYSCTVVDISVGGAQLALDQSIRPYTIVTLTIENFGTFHGRIVWSRGDRHGVQFFDAARLTMQRVATAV